MPIGKLKKLVHLSQATYAPNTRLVPGHNDKGYGIFEDEEGREVYFSHELSKPCRPATNLRRGQLLEFTLEDAPYLRAETVKIVTAISAGSLRPAA